MNPENHPTEDLDVDILQCKADILRALQQASQSGALRNKSKPSAEEPAQEPDFFASTDTEKTASTSIQDNTNPVGVRILSFDQLQKASDQKKGQESPDMSIPASASPDSEPALSRQANADNSRLDQLISQIQELEKQLSDERLRTQNLTSDLAGVRLQAENAGEQLKRLQGELKEQKTLYESYLIQNKEIQSSLETQAGQTQAELESKNTELNNAQQKLAEIQEQLAAREDEIQQQKIILDSTSLALTEKQQLLEQNQSIIQSYEQQIKAQSDYMADAEQKQRQIEQLKFEQIEQQEQFQQRKAGLESQIASLEQLTDQLKQENCSLSQDLASARQAMADIEETMRQSRRDMETALREKMELANSMSEIQSLSRQQQESLAGLHQQNELLSAQMQETAGHLDAARSELTQQNHLFEQTIQQLKLRIAELEDQIVENDALTDNRISELKHLIDEQKSLLEKTEHQRRELENRLAGLQAENDRLCAAREEADSLRDQLLVAQEKLENANHQLERARGDAQLVGEENNQLHSMLYLRDHELEKLQAQIQELQGRISGLEYVETVSPDEQTVSDLPSQSFERPVDELAQIDSAQIQEESEAEIPTFNLAEQIMAEHRRSVASQRQSPVARPQRSREDSISRVVGHFIKTPDTAETESMQISARSENEYAPQLPERYLTQNTPPRDIEPYSSELLFADIVKRDILWFLDKRQKSLQRPSWSWNHN
ncbi:MAG: hypothetical protein JXB18_02670 [Sedimentisphaerales bacterium]|nr:hypothetical protein [Sedimentisphaerales bacterium]